MLLDFISTVSAGFGAAGILLILGWLLRLVTGFRLPRWVVPSGVGLAMLSFAVWNEYTWYPRVTSQLPDEVVIASAPLERAWYRPWTYAEPLVTRFAAVDRTALLRSTTNPALIVAPVVLVQRWTPTRRITVAFDCEGHRRADLVDGDGLGEDGTLTGVDWREVGPEDALVKAACDGG